MTDELKGNVTAQGAKASPEKVLVRGSSCSAPPPTPMRASLLSVPLLPPWISSLPSSSHETHFIPYLVILLSASSARPESFLPSSHFCAELQISASSLQFLKYPWHQLHPPHLQAETKRKGKKGSPSPLLGLQ